MNTRGGILSITVALVAASLGSAFAQAPPDGEFLVNTYTFGYQDRSKVAMDAGGGFVVAWVNNPRGWPTAAVMAKRFDDRSRPLGAEFNISTGAEGGQSWVELARRPAGGFVAVWSGLTDFFFQSSGVYARVFDADGNALGPNIVVEPDPAAGRPRIAVDANGGFVVAWRTYPPYPEHPSILVRRFGPSGTPTGAATPIGTSTAGFPPIEVDVAARPAGDFVVAWNNTGGTLAARRLDAAGAPAGAQFQVNSTTGDYLSAPRVVVGPSGGLAFAWTKTVMVHHPPPLPTEKYDYPYARAYDAAGVPQGSEFAADTAQGELRALVADPEGTFVVAWQLTSAAGVGAQRFDGSGRAAGPPFSLSTAGSFQRRPALAIDPGGNLVAAWDALNVDGAGTGVMARRFGALRGSGLVVDPVAGQGSDGNRVFEPGESVVVAPAWRNVSGMDQELSGSAFAFTGPPGTYSVLEGSAAYGLVPNGETRDCGDTGECYVLGVNQSGERPATHWDAALSETLAPASAFARTWTLHLGDSFTDVPRGSAFYRHVEAILHNGVTAGCGGRRYCPTASTTREQMAVFLLVAKEGASYQPPACAAPGVFSDVPDTSPYCRWIEELYRRGVTSGCGGDTYCPSAAVTRQEMAVFVLGTLDPELDPPACTVPLFNDVPASSPFCRWVEELARRGIVAGCGGGAYCPGTPIPREQMSVFLAATFGLTLYGP